MAYYNTELKHNMIVFGKVSTFSKMGTYFNIIDHDNIEGFLSNTELDKKVYSPEKQFKMDKIYPLLVMSTSEKTTDLSYKRVDQKTREDLLNKFLILTNIKSLADDLVYLTKLDTTLVYSKTLWMFFVEDYMDKSKTMYADFIKNPEKFVVHLKDDYPEESSLFVESMKSRTTYSKMNMSHFFKLIIYDDDAITKLRNVLTYEDNESGTIITYNSSPKYQINTSGDDKTICIDNIKKVLSEIRTRLNDTSNIFISDLENISCESDDYLCSTKNTTVTKDNEFYVKPLNKNNI